MKDKQPPSREAFVCYWKDHHSGGWRDRLWYIGYLGGLAAYAFVITRHDLNERRAIISLVVAAAYVILVPYFTIRHFHIKFGRFIRCIHCGDWFGQDSSGAFYGPNPKYKSVTETGRCTNCGRQVLLD